MQRRLYGVFPHGEQGGDAAQRQGVKIPRQKDLPLTLRERAQKGGERAAQDLRLRAVGRAFAARQTLGQLVERDGDDAAAALLRILRDSGSVPHCASVWPDRPPDAPAQAAEWPAMRPAGRHSRIPRPFPGRRSVPQERSGRGRAAHRLRQAPPHRVRGSAARSMIRPSCSPTGFVRGCTAGS